MNREERDKWMYSEGFKAGIVFAVDVLKERDQLKLSDHEKNRLWLDLINYYYHKQMSGEKMFYFIKL